MASKSLTFNIFGKDRTASKAISGVGKSTGLLRKQFLALGGVIAGAFAVKAIYQFGKVAVQEFAAAEESQNRLTDAFARFPKAANLNITALRKLNTQLQNKTRFDDDALAAGQAQLFQYKLTAKQVADLTPLLADYAAKTGKDLPSAARLLGKALLGQGRGLKDIGVNFKDAGSVTANYAQLIDILKDKVGGFAESEGMTFVGQLAILTNQFGELKEKIGGVFAPALGHLAKIMGDQVLPLFDHLVSVIGPQLSKFFDTSAVGLGAFIDAISTGVTTGDWGPLTDFFKQVAPVLPVVVAGLGELGAALSDPEVQSALKDLVVNGLPPLVDLLVALAPLIAPLANLLSGALVPSIQSVGESISGITALFSGDIEKQREWLRHIFSLPGPLGDQVRMMAGFWLGAFNSMIDVSNFLVDALENVINTFSALTGVRVNLPSIPHVSLGGTVLGGSTPYKAGTFGSPNGSGGSGGGTSGRTNPGMFAAGGIIGARPGGMHAIVGEGRYDEAVLPLSPKVLSQLGGGGGDTYILNVSGSFVGDETKLMQKFEQMKRNVQRRGGIPRTA